MSSTTSSQVSTPEGSKPMATRKSKGKSRLGCARCKSARVKCDERHPSCSRCARASQTCVYSVVKTPKWKSSTSTLVLQTQIEPKNTTRKKKSPQTAVPTPTSKGSSVLQIREALQYDSSIPPQLSPVSTEDAQLFDTCDVFLLLHFTSKTSQGLWGSQRMWIEDVMSLAFQHPFLMHAIFALAARHLQIFWGPNNKYDKLELYHYQQALSIYRTNILRDFYQDHDAALATSFIFTYYSCSLLDFKPNSDQLSDDASITFLQGIKTIILAGQHRAFGGPLRDLFRVKLTFHPEIPAHGPGRLLLNLVEGLPSTSKYFPHRELYTKVICSLTGCLDSCTLQNLDQGYAEELVICFLKWQTFCSRDFITLIRSDDEIALCILAHYYAAAACHLVRVSKVWWWWRDKPTYMVETISEYLDDHKWDTWMEWPRRMLQISKAVAQPYDNIWKLEVQQDSLDDGDKYNESTFLNELAALNGCTALLQSTSVTIPTPTNALVSQIQEPFRTPRHHQ